jgi:hypothetical protein
MPAGSKPLYLFFNLLERAKDPENLADNQIGLFWKDAADVFNVPLPRLSNVEWLELKGWVQSEITPNEGTAMDILDAYFPDLPDEGVTMRLANDKLTNLIADLNNRDPKTTSYNLY